MARRKVILPNWKVSEIDAQNKEMLDSNFSELSQGELVINTTSGITSLTTLDERNAPVVFESSEMIDRRLEGFLDKVHQHDNKEVLDGITSGMVESWNKAESNAVATASAYTDSQIKFLVSGATDAFDTLKEVETWITNHSGQADTMIASINAISGVAHSHNNYTVLNGITEEDVTVWRRIVSSAHNHTNKTVLDDITSERVTDWDAAEPNQKAFSEVSFLNYNGQGHQNISANTSTDKLSIFLEKGLVASETESDGKSVKIGIDSGIYLKSNDLVINASVDNTTGTPAVDVTKTGSTFNFSFTGLKGEQGPKGEDGTSVRILGQVDSDKDLPDNAEVGDGYMIDGHLWVYNGTWVDAGPIKGPQGEKGEQGEQGEVGNGIREIKKVSSVNNIDTYHIFYTHNKNPEYVAFTVTNGVDGSNGKDGQDGADGSNGENGITPEFISVTATVNNTDGAPSVSVVSAKTNGEKYSLEFNFANLKGEQGPKGEDGTSVKILGEVSSDKDLPEKAEVGDGYMIDGHLWVYNGTWTDAGPIKGPQGDKGETGNGIKEIKRIASNNNIDTYYIYFTDGTNTSFTVTNGTNGKDGVDGNDGTDGTNGKDGSAWYNGITSPSTSLGVNGDWYINTLTWDISYKESNAWVTKGNIKGSDGTNGTNGTNGEDGAPGQDGNDGNMWHVGTGTPLTTLGAVGDLYLEGVVGTVYQKRDGNYWLPTDCNLKGPKGNDGTFDSSELSNYVRTDNTNYTNAVTNTHSHSNKTVLDNITSAKVTSWDNAESNQNAFSVFSFRNETNTVNISASTTTDELQILLGKGISGYINSEYPFKHIQLETHEHENYDILSSITAEKIAPSFRYVKLGVETSYQRLSASTSEEIMLMAGRGIDISGNTSANAIKIIGPTMSMYDYATGIIYSNEGSARGNFSLYLADKFLSVSGACLDNDITKCHTWNLSVKTGTTKDTLAVGNHTHSGTYLTLTDYETEREDIYDAITDSEGVTLTSVTGKTYLIGCSGKTGELIRGLHTSTTDIYMEGGEVYAASDERLKNFGDNVEVDFEKLLSIPKVYYTWKNDESKNNMIGTSAQKLKEIYPELVSENEDGKMAVSYEKLSIIALAAVDKLHKENEELKDRLKRIEEKLGL